MNGQGRTPLFSTKLVFGLTVIALGLLFMADRLHLYDGWRLLAWWPAVLALFGIAHLVRDGFLSRGGHLWLGFSVAGFLQQFGPWGLLDRWWPVFLVWGGLIITLRAVFPQPRRMRRPGADPTSPASAISCDAGSDSMQVKP
ncbi:MAG: DUF5668 domain-containing protein [Geothrix sp.]|nr:DUF5668 domain-containing protein [Geothrix sp.]